MKTRLSLLLCALLALTACSNDDNDVTQNPEAPTTEAPQTIKFNLTASHPDDDAAAQTRAVKQTWEAGDAIFVFFTGAEAPKHLKMTFDGTSWSSAEYDGTTQTAGALGLKNGDTGTMRAVFLPFGSDATVSASGTSFTFSTTYYAYYATATLSYTVTDNEVSGAFDMVIPEGYVQFFVEDAEAVDEACLLGTDAVIPVGVASIAADGTITETNDKTYVDDMPGYVYDNGTDPKGYIFTGKLNGSYAYYDNYYFSKTEVSVRTRHDYFVTGKTLASHSAVKLPANGNYKWKAVGSGIPVTIYYDAGSGLGGAMGWQTCNYGCSKPEDLGTQYTFDAAKAIDGIKMPSIENFQDMVSNCSWTWLTIHGMGGMVVKGTSGFIFLPANFNTYGIYWTSNFTGGRSADVLLFHKNNTITKNNLETSSYYGVRERYW